MAHVDDESVLDPLLNAPCFGCKNSDSAKHRRPKFRKLAAETVMLVSRSGAHEPPHFSLEEKLQIFHLAIPFSPKLFRGHLDVAFALLT